MNVFFTVDTEIWCNSWDGLDTQFPGAFSRYVYGPTRKGDHGLPLKLKVLNDHGLNGVFFIEPLFALRFGLDALAEVVGLVTEAGQEVQLHLHTEWVDEAPVPPIAGQQGKRQFLHMYSKDEQVTLLRTGMELLAQAGAPAVNAFRAGGFGMDVDTSLQAVHEAGLVFDSSYHPGRMPPENDIAQGRLLTQPLHHAGAWEYPMTVYQETPKRLRQLQLGSCSAAEMQTVLDQALHAGWNNIVLLSHNFELMNQARTAPDPVVVRRYAELARFLEREASSMPTCGFVDLQPKDAPIQLPPPRILPGQRPRRMFEQAWRRVYR